MLPSSQEEAAQDKAHLLTPTPGGGTSWTRRRWGGRRAAGRWNAWWGKADNAQHPPPPAGRREDARRLSEIPASWASGERTQLKTSPWGECRFPCSTKVEHPRKPSCSWTHTINRDEAQVLTDTAHSSRWRLDAEMLSAVPGRSLTGPLSLLRWALPLSRSLQNTLS